MDEELNYFRGWKDACYDLADFLDNLSKNAPEKLKEMASSLAIVSQSLSLKGDTAWAMAESTHNKGH